MTHRLTILLLLFVGLSISLTSLPTAATDLTVTEPTRLTYTGKYDNLLAWQEESVVATDTDGVTTIKAVSPGTGAETSCTLDTCASRVPTPDVVLEVNGTTHRLLLS